MNSWLISVRHLWTARILPLWRALSSVLWRLFLVLAISVLFKYLFFTNCLSVQSVKTCVTSSLNDTSIIFTLGGLLLALFIMIPTFWIENKIKDASNEVKKGVLAETQDIMQKLSQAQMLIFEADKASFQDLLRVESLVKEAVDLWPAFKQREYRKLGLRMAEAVIHDGHIFTDNPKEPYVMWIYKQNERSWLARSAISYLTETVLKAATPEAEDLLNLACMYGYQQKFDQMIQIIEKAVKIDEAIKEKFRERAVLLMLLRGCRSDRSNIEKLETKIGIPPVSKDSFSDFIKTFDLVDFHTYIEWLAVKRPSAPGGGSIFVIKIGHPLPSKEEIVSAYAQNLEDGKIEPIVPDATPVPVEELYDKLHPLFYLICYVEPEY